MSQCYGLWYFMTAVNVKCSQLNKSLTVFCASVLLLITDDVIKCSKLQVEQASQVVSLHSFGHFTNVCHHLLSIRVQTMENHMRFVLYNKLKSASERRSEGAFVLCDRSRQLHASVLLLVTAGSQSETRTVAFCCKSPINHQSIRYFGPFWSKLSRDDRTRPNITSFKRNIRDRDLQGLIDGNCCGSCLLCNS